MVVMIVLGIVVEWIKFFGYILIVMFVVGCFYFIVGYWVWGNVFLMENLVLFVDLGFFDFVGVMVVYLLGVWVGLVVVLVIGFCMGCFNLDGILNIILGYLSVFLLGGLLIFFIGWLGFNGGLVSLFDFFLSLIIVNMFIVVCFGVFGGIFVGVVIECGLFWLSVVISGLFGGLVVIMVGCVWVLIVEFVVIGVIGGIIVVGVVYWILCLFCVDDFVDVIVIYGVVGVVGMLLVVVFVDFSVLV